MGKYINDINGVVLPAKGKAAVLIANGAKEIMKPRAFRDDLVCVLDNGSFEAACYCYNESEFKECLKPCGRPKTWLIVDNAPALV